MNRPLEGYLVLDLTTALAGPYATLLLAGLGARVVKVENPATDGDPARNNAPFLGPSGLSLGRVSPEDESLSHLARSRNKESICLDLKTPEGLKTFRRLAQKADVVIENFSPGVTQRLGISFDSLREENPNLVYTSISGFGSEEAGGRAMDTIVQALSGVMMTSGETGAAPVRSGLPVADLLAPVFAVMATLTALLDRERSEAPEARHIDVSMLGALTSFVSVEPHAALEALGVPTRTGQHVPRLAPFGSFPTRDGWIAICAPLDSVARRLLLVMHANGQETSTDYSTRDARVRNADSLHRDITLWSSDQTSRSALRLLADADVPAAEVRKPSEAVMDPRVVDRGDVVDIGKQMGRESGSFFGPGVPFSISGMDLELDRPAPALGADTESILAELMEHAASNPSPQDAGQGER